MYKLGVIDTRRLANFVAVVDEGGFSRARDGLGISQPAVSHAVGELEGGLATALFFRIGRRVRLTAAGDALILPARQVQRDLHNARLAVADITELGSRRLDLACLPTLASAPLPPLVGAFRPQRPDVFISLGNPHSSTELLEFVQSRRSEVGLVEDVSVEDLTTVALGSQDFLVVLPPGSVASEPLSIAQLATMALMGTPKRTSSRDRLDGTLHHDGIAEQAKLLACVVVAPSPKISRAVALACRGAPLTPAAQRFVDQAIENEHKGVDAQCS